MFPKNPLVRLYHCYRQNRTYQMNQHYLMYRNYQLIHWYRMNLTFLNYHFVQMCQTNPLYRWFPMNRYFQRFHLNHLFLNYLYFH
jgi:hypothetical protein